MIKIAPSLLAADFADLKTSLAAVEKDADLLHLDIMDGSFVPNISYGIPVIKAIRPHSDLLFDVHLMIEKPDRYLKAFADAGADLITVHAEACTHLHRTLGAIRELGCKAGVALNPHTPLCVLENVMDELDLVLIMSVNPGFGGQSFIEGALKKIRSLKRMLAEAGRAESVMIAVDGGIKAHNVKAVYDAGVDFAVAGSAVFKAPDPAAAIRELKSQAL